MSPQLQHTRLYGSYISISRPHLEQEIQGLADSQTDSFNSVDQLNTLGWIADASKLQRGLSKGIVNPCFSLRTRMWTLLPYRLNM